MKVILMSKMVLFGSVLCLSLLWFGKLDGYMLCCNLLSWGFWVNDIWVYTLVQDSYSNVYRGI